MFYYAIVLCFLTSTFAAPQPQLWKNRSSLAARLESLEKILTALQIRINETRSPADVYESPLMTELQASRAKVISLDDPECLKLLEDNRHLLFLYDFVNSDKTIKVLHDEFKTTLDDTGIYKSEYSQIRLICEYNDELNVCKDALNRLTELEDRTRDVEQFLTLYEHSRVDDKFIKQVQESLDECVKAKVQDEPNCEDERLIMNTTNVTDGHL